MLDFPNMNWQTRSLKAERHSPLPMFPAHWPRPLQRLVTLATLFGDEIFLTTLFHTRFLRFPRKSWPFPISSTVNCLDFAATVTAFSCPFKQNKTEREFFLQRLRTLSVRSNSPPPGLSASELLRRAIFGTTSSIFDRWSRPCGVARLLGLRGVHPRPHPSEGVGLH